MRFRLADLGSENYMHTEPFLNNLKLISVNSGTELVLGVAQVDSSGNQVVPEGTGTGIDDGNKSVTTAGTRETLVGVSTACKEVTISADEDNTGTIVVGGTSVVAALGTRRGIPLEASDTVTIKIDDLQKINIDSTVNGEGVTFLYTT